MELSRFSVYMTYGFSLVAGYRDNEKGNARKDNAKRVRECIKMWIEKKSLDHALRPGWSPVYRPDIKSDETFPIRMDKRILTKQLVIENGDSNFEGSISVNIKTPEQKQKVEVEYSTTLQQDRYGALTIALHVLPKDKGRDKWQIGDIITTLLMAPQTIGNSEQDPIARINLEDKEENPYLHNIFKKLRDGNLIMPDSYSPVYQFFAIGLSLVAKEIQLPDDTVLPRSEETKTKPSHCLDPQILYFYILGDVVALKDDSNVKTFEQCYFQSMQDQQGKAPPIELFNAHISQQIASILYRW